MKRQTNDVDAGRRAVLLGVAGVAALLAAKGGSALAQEMKPPTVKVIGESASTVSGFPKVRIREATWQPGNGLKTRPMPNDMVCEMTQGSLDVVVAGKPMTRETGDVWTCKKGLEISDVNKGSTPAVMRIVDLLEA